MSLLVANWSDKQLDELADLLATGDFSSVANFISQNFLCQGSRIMYGGTRTDHAIDNVELTVSEHIVGGNPTTAVDLSAGVFQHNSLLSQVDTTQTINILDDTYGTWGTGQAAHATLNRWSIICVKNAEQAQTPALRWFVDDSPDPNTYSQISTNTKINKAYYDIQVVHGSNVATASYNDSNPTIPAGYFVIAEIFVPAAATAILTANIHDTTGTSGKTPTPNWDSHTRVLRLEFYNDFMTMFAVDHDPATGYHRVGFHIGSDPCSANVTATNLDILTAGPTSDASALHKHVGALTFLATPQLLSNTVNWFSWQTIDITPYVSGSPKSAYVQWAFQGYHQPVNDGVGIIFYEQFRKNVLAPVIALPLGYGYFAPAYGHFSSAYNGGFGFIELDSNTFQVKLLYVNSAPVSYAYSLYLIGVTY